MLGRTFPIPPLQHPIHTYIHTYIHTHIRVHTYLQCTCIDTSIDIAH